MDDCLVERIEIATGGADKRLPGEGRKRPRVRTKHWLGLSDRFAEWKAAV